MAKSRRPRGGKRKIRVVLVDDHPIFRDGARSLINLQPDMEMCAEADGANEGMRVIFDVKPDLAIIDISLGDGNGISLIKEVKARRADLPILVLTMHDDPTYAERAVKAGATGYVTKHEDPSTVLTAIRRLLDGGAYISENLASAIVLSLISPGRKKAGSVLGVLSDREFEVLHMIGQGLGTREIAEQLHLSPRTVQTHRGRIKKKLGLKSATELVRCALRWAGDAADV